MNIPRKVRNCVTHHVCDCIKWRLEQAESALKVIHIWAEWDKDNPAMRDIAKKALEGLRKIPGTGKEEER